VEVEYIEFELGDNVVYPTMGPARCSQGDQGVFGERREYLTIKICTTT